MASCRSDSIAEKMASGIVWVSSFILPAKRRVAPNSPSDRAQAREAPATIPGSEIGSATRKKAETAEEPKVRATINMSGSTFRNELVAACMKKGEDTTIWAIITALAVKGIESPRFCNRLPSSPSRPKVCNRPTPNTAGGITIGSATTSSMILVDLDLEDASHQARGVPNKQVRARLIDVVFRLKKRAGRNMGWAMPATMSW